MQQSYLRTNVYERDAFNSIVTMQGIDEFNGVGAKLFRTNKPVVFDVDRGEFNKRPGTAATKSLAYFYRQLMWSNIVSGAHATYGGIRYVRLTAAGVARAACAH
jgi:hypothetical protein